MSLNQLERSVVDVLAWQRLEQLLCPPGPSTPPVVTKPLPARALVCPLVQDCHLQDWAVKTPTPTYSSEPVLMTYRIMRVGKGNLPDSTYLSALSVSSHFLNANILLRDRI